MSAIQGALDSLTGIPGVRGAMLANRDAGSEVAAAGVEDVASAHVVWTEAERRNAGTVVELGGIRE